MTDFTYVKVIYDAPNSNLYIYGTLYSILQQDNVVLTQKIKRKRRLKTMTIIVTREYPDGFRLVKVHDGNPINDKVYGSQKDAYADARRTFPSGKKMILGYKVPYYIKVC